jgi:hypothetical protein
MGCWNGTCALTNLPIMDGDPVALYIMKKSYGFSQGGNGGGFCNANQYYKPLPYVVYGNYNDYGCLEDIVKGDSWEILEEYFKRFPSEEEDIIRNIERGNLPDYGILMIHRQVHDSAVEEIGKRTIYGGGTCVREYTKIINKNIKLSKDVQKDKMNNGKYFWGISENLGFELRTDDFFVTQLMQGRHVTEMFDKVLDYLLICAVFDDTRKFWFPQSGAGSQNEEYDLLKIFSDFVYKKADEAESRQEEDD